jgi:hypothetical protein
LIFLGYFFKFYFFSILFFNIRLLGFELLDFFCFSFYELIPISCLESWVSRVTQVNSSFFDVVLMIAFLVSPFHYLVCLRDNLNYFIKFILYEVILVSQPCHKFGKLTQIEFFLSFFFSSLSYIWFACNWVSTFFFFLLSSWWCYPVLIRFFCFVIE